jgi:hypothetical protein
MREGVNSRDQIYSASGTVLLVLALVGGFAVMGLSWGAEINTGASSAPMPRGAVPIMWGAGLLGAISLLMLA